MHLGSLIRGGDGAGRYTLYELTQYLAARAPPPGEPWTGEWMELVVRAAVHDAGVDAFSLDDEFVRDMKLD